MKFTKAMSIIIIKQYLIIIKLLIMFVNIKANEETPTTPSEVTKTFASLNILRQGDGDNDEDIKQLLEEKYKFRNDETSTRYRITRVEGKETAKEGGTLKALFIFMVF